MSFSSGLAYRQKLARANAQGRLLTEVDVDRSTGRMIHRVSQDVEPILEENKRLYNDGDGYSPSREWRRAASIPLVLCNEWLNQGINIFRRSDWPKIRRMLNSREYIHLRTAPGRL